jgi:hypothetical protein
MMPSQDASGIVRCEWPLTCQNWFIRFGGTAKSTHRDRISPVLADDRLEAMAASGKLLSAVEAERRRLARSQHRVVRPGRRGRHACPGLGHTFALYGEPATIIWPAVKVQFIVQVWIV